MDFRLLGPMEVHAGGMSVRVTGKSRALLAVLLLNANRAMAADTLVDDLWGDEAPETARKMIQIYASQLRKALPEPRLLTRGGGYLLEVGEGELDLERFGKSVVEGRHSLADGRAPQAAELLHTALAMWRGPALAEFDEPFAEPERARLEELRLAAQEELVDAELALGRHAAVVGELERLVARHPLRERLRGQHMLALYRSGRQAEALAAYLSFRRLLDEELGIEPSSRLRELHGRILRQDAELDAPAPTGARTADRRVDEPFEVRYVRSGDLSIAYQVVGDGSLDLVLVHGWVCTFQPGWERPQIARFYRRLASMGRLVLFDKRGTGLSDRVSGIAPLEERMDDVRAILDEIGSTRAVVLGISEGGPMTALFAATYPERTAGIVVMGSFARRTWAPDYPIGQRESELWWAQPSAAQWGLPFARRFVDERAPSVAGNEAAIRWYARYFTRGASPGAAVQLGRMNREIDVRHVLTTIHVPALVLYRAGEYLRDQTRYMGERIPNAELVELPGADHLPWEGDQDRVLDEIERFVGGLEAEVVVDRVLATVLVVSIAGARERRNALGDDAWNELLGRHLRLVRAALVRHRGRELDVAGDRVLARFDGPARAIRCAAQLVREARALGVELRAGLHTGEVELADAQVRGVTVDVGARVAGVAGPGEVLVSETVKDIVAGSGLEFEDRGTHRLDDAVGRRRLYAAAPSAL